MGDRASKSNYCTDSLSALAPQNATGRTAKPFVKRRKPRTPTIKIAMLIYKFSARLCRNAMAGVAKRLRHWIVVPVFGGSIPLVCPIY